jgi:hypothetical protein
MSKILNLRRMKPAINFFSEELRGLWNFSVPEECLALAKPSSRATETSSPLQFDKSIMESVVFIGQIGIDIQVKRALRRIVFFFLSTFKAYTFSWSVNRSDLFILVWLTDNRYLASVANSLLILWDQV